MSFFGTLFKTAVGAGTGFLTGGPAGAAAGGISALTGSIAADKSKKATTQAVTAQTSGVQQLIDAAKAAQAQVGGYQQQSQDRQIAEANGNRDYQYNLNAPTIARGDDASADYAGFLNGDASGLTAFRDNTGYQDLLNTGLGAVNANASFRGARNSGAALKALQDRATGIADQSAGSYLGNLQPLISAGANARGLTAQIGQQTVGAINGAIDGAATANSQAAQNVAGAVGQGALIGADAQSNAALVNGKTQSNLISQLGSLGLDALTSKTGSSFNLNSLFGKKAAVPTGTVSSLSSLFKDPFSVSGTNYNTTRLF